MCGRFVRYSPLHEIVREFDTEEPSFDLAPSYNIAPSHEVAVVRQDGKRHIIPCRWGFIPSWAEDPKIGYRMINARAESAADKPSFREAFKNSRILVPADGFYEWKKEDREKTPVFIHLKSKRPFGIAGLLSMWNAPEGRAVCTCTILTTDANSSLKSFHDRMPVILRKGDEDTWLDSHISDRDRLSSLLRPYDAKEMDFHPVSKLANSPANNSPDCIKPL